MSAGDVGQEPDPDDGVPLVPEFRPRIAERRVIIRTDLIGTGASQTDEARPIQDAGGDVSVGTGEDPNGPGDPLPSEAHVEGALASKYRARRLAAAEKTVRNMAPQQEVDATPDPEDVKADDMASPMRDAQPPTAGSGGSRVADVAKDIGRGLIETPRQIVGGVRDAAQAAIDLGDWVADKAEEIAPLGGIQLFNDKGELAPAIIPAGDPRLAPAKTGGTLPKVKEPTTVTGGVVRGVAQFLAGFVGAGGAMGSVIKSLPKARAIIQGGLANFAAFGSDQQRLADLIEKYPALSNPVTRYLESQPEDSFADSRLKNAIEGLGLGVMAEGLFKAIRYVRDARRAGAGGAAEQAAREKARPREAQPLMLLGDEKAPLLARGEAEPAADGTVKAATLEPGAQGVPDDIVAKSISHAALSEGKNGVYVNFARIETPDDVKRVIATTAEAFKSDIDAARRGVRSNEATMKAADGEDAWKALMERRFGQPMNAEQSLAARRLWEASAAKLLDVAKAAEAAPSPENLFQFRRMMAIHNAVQTEVIAARTETARALQSWRIPVGGGDAERLRSIENILATHGGNGTAQQLASEIAALGRTPDGMAALADVVEKGVTARTVEVAKEIWINALLSNPKTHVVNMMGNMGGLALELVERTAAGAYSRAIGSGAMSPTEGAAKMFALSRGSREGFRLFWKALKSGESQFGVETTKVADAGFVKSISADAMKLDPNDWAGRAVDTLGSVVNLPTRFLSAEDDFFKAIAYRMEVNALAVRTASREVADGVLPRENLNERIATLIASPPESARLSAVDYSSYQTYTSKPGSLVQAINGFERSLMRGSAGEQISSLALRMLIPFRNTPANLVKYSFERTPLAPLMNRYREAIAQGGAEADIARARMSLGTMSMLALMDFALDGTITGGGPKGDQNKGNMQTLLRSGWQPYSIKVGDRYYSYRRTDPFGLFMGTAADIADIISNATVDDDKRDSVLAAAGMASASFGNLVLDKTYMSTVSSTIDVLHNPDRAPTFFQQRFAAFNPAVLGEIRRQIDPYVRYSASFVEELKNRTPGLSENLPPARDMWGRQRSYQSGLGQVYDALSPIASRKHDPEPVDREAIANDFNLAMPSWTISFGKAASLALRNRPEMYSRLLEIRGQEKPSSMVTGHEASLLLRKYGDRPMLQLLNDIVEGRAGELSTAYASAGGGRNGGKDEMVTRIVADYTRAAKVKLLSEFKEAADVVARKQAKRAASR